MKGKDEPASYPAVYAVADGVVNRIDTHFALPGGNDRYGLDLTFAKHKSGSAFQFCYSIEPMAQEPSEGFYKKFLLVKEFHERCDGFRWMNGGEPIPPCMGYRIGAEENPFGSGAKDRL